MSLFDKKNAYDKVECEHKEDGRIVCFIDHIPDGSKPGYGVRTAVAEGVISDRGGVKLTKISGVSKKGVKGAFVNIKQLEQAMLERVKKHQF